jgi:hypothetical protein
MIARCERNDYANNSQKVLPYNGVGSLRYANTISATKAKSLFSDDFCLESSSPTYLWFYDQKGILDNTHAVDGTFVEIVKAFAKNCECAVVREPDDADYVVMISRHDVVFRPKLAEKKFIVVKVDSEKLIAKGSIRRIGSIASDSCTAILKDSKQNTASGSGSEH